MNLDMDRLERAIEKTMLTSTYAKSFARRIAAEYDRLSRDAYVECPSCDDSRAAHVAGMHSEES